MSRYFYIVIFMCFFASASLFGQKESSQHLLIGEWNVCFHPDSINSVDTITLKKGDINCENKGVYTWTFDSQNRILITRYFPISPSLVDGAFIGNGEWNLEKDKLVHIRAPNNVSSKFIINGVDSSSVILIKK